jgi:tRNA(His) 5'-end guanylyltransferase
MWFEGNVQKIVSVAASIFTTHFARNFASGTFDARVMVIPRRADVEQYFIWRQLDATANSLNMLASAHYTHDELLGKSMAEKHDLLHAKGINWSKAETSFKRGRVIRPAASGWEVDLEPPIFTREPEYLARLIPEDD